MVAPKARDLTYEYDLYRRIGEVVVDGVPLKEHLFFGTYALWHRFAQYVFSSDIVRYSAAGSYEAYMQSEGGQNKALSFKGLLVGLFAVLITLLAINKYRITRPTVLIFGIDRLSDKEFKSDFRSHALYEFLTKNNIAYGECLHTVFGKVFVTNFFRRFRPVIYLEAFDTLYALARALGMTERAATLTFGDLNDFSIDEAKFARYVIKKYLGQTGAVEHRIRALKNCLTLSGAKVVWAIDDARHYHDLLIAAHEVSVPSYAFQHGHYTPFHVGWLAVPGTKGEYVTPDHLVVWSKYWQIELAQLNSVFSSDSILIGAPERKNISLPAHTADRTVLIPHETDSPKEKIAEIIRTLIAADMHVVMKLRPDYTRDAQLSQYPGLSNLTGFSTVSSLSELQERPTCSVGVYSTFLYEMVEAGVPVGVLVDVSPYGHGMVDNGLARAIRNASLVSDIEALIGTSADECKERAHKLFGTPTLSETLQEISRTMHLI